MNQLQDEEVIEELEISPVSVDVEEEVHSKFPHRDYKLQETHDHDDFKLFFKCSCTLALSENHLDIIIPILKKRQKYLKEHKPKVVKL